MKQVIVKKGKAVIENVPSPSLSDNTVLVQTAYSCISAGTELSDVKSTGGSLIEKALRKPEKVKMVVDMTLSEGIQSTWNKVTNKLETGTPTGYSASGTVIEIGKNIHNLKVGDRVACAGAGIANHAEFIEVPKNLLVKIPDGVDLDVASTITLGAIAMQGVRRAAPQIGEYVVVTGLGILGQITVELLKASGCKVIGIDLDDRRINMALNSGMYYGLNPKTDNVVEKVINLTGGYGADCVIIATATSSRSPLDQAFQMSRKKGRVVLVGTVGMEFNREDMYKKELDFYISTSYGPGRYDSNYEEYGIDYPHAYVRWTENRNMSSYLELIKDKKIDIKQIIEKVYDIQKADEAFLQFEQQQKPLIVLLRYPANEQPIKKINTQISAPNKNNKQINVAIAGAGAFAKEMHLPNLFKLKDNYRIQAIMSRTGYNAKTIATQYKASYATTEYDDLLNDKDVDLIMICSRHEHHADMALKAIKAQKAVFVEKPMALTEDDLKLMVKELESSSSPFMVGFNRRFSKYAVEAKKHIDKRVSPLFIHYRMNAGYIPEDNWVHKEGGRIIGEACHIIDLMTFFTGSKVVSINVESLTPSNSKYMSSDNKSIILKYEDGSICTIEYFAVGSKLYPKEFCEIHFDEKTIVLDDYKSIQGFGVNVASLSSTKSEKGQYEELVELYNAIISGTKYPIPLWDLEQTTKISFLAGM